MTEEVEYRREVLLISLEKDNKRLLEIYRRGEEKDTLSQRAYENVYERVSYALSSSSLMDLEKLPDLEERIISMRVLQICLSLQQTLIQIRCLLRRLWQ